jgi:IS30 family transposase
MSTEIVTDLVRVPFGASRYGAKMVTGIRKGSRRHLYMVEWREHQVVSAEKIAERLNVTRQTIHKWEREQQRMNPAKQSAYAEAIGISAQDLWRRPSRPSVDGMLDKVPDDQVQNVVELVTVFLRRAGSK